MIRINWIYRTDLQGQTFLVPCNHPDMPYAIYVDLSGGQRHWIVDMSTQTRITYTTSVKRAKALARAWFLKKLES